MVNRWAVLLAVAGTLCGYALGGTSTAAQTESLPFAVGDEVVLWYAKHAESPNFGSSVNCAVTEVRGEFVRCGRLSRVGGGSDRSESWLSLKYVVSIAKRER